MKLREKFEKITGFQAKLSAMIAVVAVIAVVMFGLWTIRWVVINFNAVTINKAIYEVPNYDRVCIIVSNSEDLSVDCWSTK